MSKCVRLRLAPSRYLHVFRSLSSRSYLVQSRPYLFGFGCISFKAWGTSSYSGNIFNARPFFYGRKENRKQERAREAVRRKQKRVGSKLCWRVMHRGISPASSKKVKEEVRHAGTPGVNRAKPEDQQSKGLQHTCIPEPAPRNSIPSSTAKKGPFLAH